MSEVAIVGGGFVAVILAALAVVGVAPWALVRRVWPRWRLDR